jgi:iron complex outermembrane recepter protein
MRCKRSNPGFWMPVDRSGTLVLAAAGMVSLVLSAAQAAESPVLAEVTVTATRIEKAVVDIPASIGVVDQSTVQRARPQLGLDESLARVPGLFMQNRFNFAQDLRVSIRGFGARANFGIRGIKIIVDGIPETLPDGQGQVDSIDLSSVGQIAVMRGPASALYGNASGGAIIVTSEAGTPEPFVEARTAFGDYGYRKNQLKVGGKSGDLSYLLSGSDLTIDGYRANSEAESRQFSGRVQYNIDESSDFSVAFNSTDQPVSNDPGQLTALQVAQDPSQARALNVQFRAGEELEQQRLGLVYNKAFGEHHAITARNYYVWRDFASRLAFAAGGAVSIERLFAGGGLMYTNTQALGSRDNRFMIGVDYDHQDDDRRRFANNNGVLGALSFDQNETVTSLGVYLQDELRLSDALELTVGLRHDQVEFDVTDRFLGDGNDSGRRRFSETSPMVGLMYAVTPAFHVYGNISTAFETPTTTEFANPNGGGGFNPGLDPQKARNYELGVKGQWGERTRYEAAIFHIDVKNELIPYQLPSTPGRDFFRNAGSSSRDGIELSFVSKPVDALELSLAYTYSDFAFDRFIDSAGNDFSGRDLPAAPAHILQGEATYAHESGLFASVDALYVDDIYADNANTVVSDGYVVANARLGYLWTRGGLSLSPFVGVSNFLDESYNSSVTINGAGGRYFEPAPERNVYGGVELRYDFGAP